MLALNSGSSSLKLGLYRVGSFRTEMLLSGAAELIGEKTANSSHKIRAEPLCFARRYPFPANGKRSYASEDFSPTPKCRHRPPSGIESCMADQSSGSIVSDDSVLRQLEAAIAFAPVHMPSALSIICFAQEHFPGLPQVASSRICRRSHVSFQSPGNCNWRVSNVTDFTACLANRSCASLRSRRQLRGRGRSQYRRSRRSSYKRLSADAAATAGGTSGAPRNAMFNLAPCLTVTTDLFWRYHKHPRPIQRLTHRAPARGALHGHLDALSSKA